MLTEEQIKSLKPGASIVINASFVRNAGDGDIHFRNIAVNGGHYDSYVHPAAVSLPPEPVAPVVKYDPYRPFKKGDIVKRRTVDGRTDPDVPEGVELTVTTGEAKYGNVRVIDPHGRGIITKWIFLELITPVEELEPYTVDECGFAPVFYVLKNGKVYMSIPYKEGSSLFQSREEALAAAEAERDRLNAEYRKEHAHD